MSNEIAMKLKATSILTRLSQMEQKYMAGNPNMQPHLIGIEVDLGKGMSYGYVIEPHIMRDAVAFYGWDIKWKRYRTIRWESIINIGLRSDGYEPVDEQTWQARIRQTNLQFNEENQIRQSKGIFR